MTNTSIKIVESYREPKENEFFFNYDPRRTAGTKQLLEYLEKHNFVFEDIPHWQIKSIVIRDYNSETNGLRVLIDAR
jgi:hypothetical protein|tara:strand:+ start:321 stop:551 length:231 start_codon:yes stop_codon:yes gene_type:complete